MRALLVDTSGDRPVMVPGEHPDPVPGEQELLIDVKLVEGKPHSSNHDLTDLVKSIESRIKDFDQVSQKMDFSATKTSNQKCLAEIN